MTEMTALMQGPPGPPGRGRPGRPGSPGPQGRPGISLSQGYHDSFSLVRALITPKIDYYLVLVLDSLIVIDESWT